MPRPPKSPDRRVRKDRPRPFENLPEIVELEIPEPPKGMLKATRDEWMELWQRPIASTFGTESLPALRRLFEMRDQRRRLLKVLPSEGYFTTGSRGQTVVSPGVKLIQDLESQIVALEDRFGLTPKAAHILGHKPEPGERKPKPRPITYVDERRRK